MKLQASPTTPRIYSLGDVSGAHFNPAVSLAVCLRGACSVPDLLAYVPVQLVAGASAGAIASRAVLKTWAQLAKGDLLTSCENSILCL